MTASDVVALEALGIRRARLAARAEELADALDKMPSPPLHRRLQSVAAAIDALDAIITTKRRGRPPP